jgi:polyisoprenoid-binding protein YceI
LQAVELAAIYAKEASGVIKEYALDPSHTTIGFAGKHMMVTTVRGRFNEFTGTVAVEDDDPTTARITATIRTASLDSGQTQRDQHLRSADFFDVERYPEMTFTSTAVEARDGNRYRVQGDLTIKDQTRPITLDVEVEERFNDPWGNERVGVTASGKLNRQSWGLTWNQVLEAGRLLVGDQIKLEIESALVRKATSDLAEAS